MCGFVHRAAVIAIPVRMSILKRPLSDPTVRRKIAPPTRSRYRPSTGRDLISDALPFGRLWYGEPNAISNAIGYAMHRSRSHDAVIRVYDETGNVIETHEHAGDFKEW
jgi:hypothetical protein